MVPFELLYRTEVLLYLSRAILDFDRNFNALLATVMVARRHSLQRDIRPL